MTEQKKQNEAEALSESELKEVVGGTATQAASTTNTTITSKYIGETEQNLRR